MIDGNFDVIGAAGPRAFFEHLTAATLSHGYLFTGAQGVGKKTFARELARSLLCVTPKRTLLGWCGVCSGCALVEAGTHPDSYFTEGQLKIGDRDGGGFHDAEEATARDLVRQLSMHSYAGGKRVFVIGDPDFTLAAANALLKFFEEPPAGVVLILTTSAVGRILPTIGSRLVEVTFPLLSDAEVVRILERRGIASEDAERAATVANGSATRALAYLDEGEGATRDAAVEWFFAAAQGDAADATGWATRPALEAGPGDGQDARARLDRARSGRRRTDPRARSARAARRAAAARAGGVREDARGDRRRGAHRAHQRQPAARRRSRAHGAGAVVALARCARYQRRVPNAASVYVLVRISAT